MIMHGLIHFHNFAEEKFGILNSATLLSTKMENTYSYCSGHILIRVIGLKEKKYRKKTGG